MKIQIRARDIKVTRALKAHVELRLGFALSRFREKIGHVAVHFSKSDERRDRKEKRFRIAVILPRRVKVQETDADLFSAVDRAAARAARSVAHAIEQEAARAPIVRQPLDGRKLKTLAALRLGVARRADVKHASPLKRRYRSSPPRKAPRPLGA